MNDRTPLAAALAAHKAGRLDEAERQYRHCLQAMPEHIEARHHLALVLGQQGRLDEAAQWLRAALRKQPRSPAMQANLGEIYRRLEDYPRAVECLREATRLAPAMGQAWFNLGLALRQLNQPGEAIQAYEEAARLQPDNGRVYYNLGNTRLLLGQYRQAVNDYEKALPLTPADRSAEIHNNLGSALLGQEQNEEAAEAFRRSLEVDPEFAQAWLNLGLAREKLGELEAAAHGYREAERKNPEAWWLELRAGTLCPEVFHSNDDIDAWRERLGKSLDSFLQKPGSLPPEQLHNSGIEPPPLLMYQGRDDRALKERFAELFAPRLPDPEPPRPAEGERYRIGFVVTHGHEGIFLRSMKRILADLPREHFELTVAVTWPAVETVRANLALDDIRVLPLPVRVDHAADTLRAEHLDVLYHWETGSDSADYFLPWFRPAPVQCTSWGWAETTGIPRMDYYISSDLLEPEDTQHSYTETLIALPNNLLTCHERPTREGPPARRADFGLPENARLYLCHQNLRKIHPDFDALAAAILEQDPRGQLVLVENSRPHLARQLMARLKQSLPDAAERVCFLPRMPKDDYLGLVSLADVALDPPHYSGANTSFDALAMGVPLVTLPSKLQRGRYTAALYRKMGMADIIPQHEDEYIEQALTLANDLEARQKLVTRIREADHAIFEDRATVDGLAQAFADMAREARKG